MDTMFRVMYNYLLQPIEPFYDYFSTQLYYS